MVELKCTTANCEHNKCERCFADNVDIDKHHVCKTKKKREGGALAQLFENYEAGASFELQSNATAVNCNATCIYNTNGECTREHLQVEDGAFRTKCSSFVKDDYPE